MSAQSKPHLQTLPEPHDFQEYFRQMAESIQEIFWVLDASTQQVIYVSPAYERICGRTCESLYGAPRSYVDVIHPQDRERVLARLGQLVQGGEFDEEFRIVRPDDEIRWVANQGFPIRDARGNIYRLAGVVQDITTRKHVEQALRSSEAIFATVFRSSPCSMTITALPDGQFIDINDRFLRQMGLARHEVIGRNVIDLGMLSDPREVSGLIAEVSQTGRLGSREIRVRTRLGKVRTGLYSSEVIELAGNRCVLTVSEDITARKEAEEALRRSEAEYRSLFEGAPCGILRATVSGHVLNANPALMRILGYASDADLLKVSLANDVFGDPAEYTKLISQHENTKRFANVGLRWKRRDGTHICVEASGTILANETDTPSYVDFMVQDVTERHTLEAKVRRAQVMEGVAEIASGLAHDYCTHLGRILGYADLLLHSSDLKGMPRRYVEQMIEAGMQARSVTRYLLGMTSKNQLRAEPIRVDELVQDLQHFLRMLVGPEIQLSVEIDGDPGLVRGDPQKLAQVIIDLTANARDAMPHGGKLSIKASALDLGYDPHHAHIQPGRYALISVTDSGHGMDQATQTRIFDPFFTTKAEGKGAGLGLSYAQLIVEKQSGGKIQVSSQPGRGSVFTIHLPCVASEATTSGHDVKATSEAQNETVLIVTGDDVLLKLTAEFLRFQGYDVLPAKSGCDALKAAESWRGAIHLLLTDLVTLGRSGEDLASDLMSAYPGMKVVYMADYGELADSAGTLTPDGAELLHKPFLSFELIAKVKRVLATAGAC
jgi:two-component system cell cycle sensor histidine kinase/response regulator CckA